MIGLIAQSPNPVPGNPYYSTPAFPPGNGHYRGNSLFVSGSFSEEGFVFGQQANQFYVAGQTFAFCLVNNTFYPFSTANANEMRIGDYLVSQNGDHKLIFQTDGNLCIYTRGAFAWSSGTQGSGANVLRMQSDGNLCLYREYQLYYPPFGTGQSFVWGSMSHDRGGFYCILQDDGNFCVYTRGLYSFCPQSCWTGNFIWGTK
jgi:hypothetical protein